MTGTMSVKMTKAGFLALSCSESGGEDKRGKDLFTLYRDKGTTNSLQDGVTHSVRVIREVIKKDEF